MQHAGEDGARVAALDLKDTAREAEGLARAPLPVRVRIESSTPTSSTCTARSGCFANRSVDMSVVVCRALSCVVVAAGTSSATYTPSS